MASRPSSSGSTLFPDWAENTANLPSTGGPNKIAPPSAHRTTGFDYNEPLTAEELNYQLNLLNKWIKYLDTPVNNPNVTIYTSPAASTSVQGYTSITVSISSALSGDAYTFPTGTITKTANQANGTAIGGTAWSAGNNSPGWISGTSIASLTWYNVYALKTSTGSLDVCFASLNTTPATVLSTLGSSITSAVWIGMFFRLNAGENGVTGNVYSSIQNTNVTFVYPFYHYNGIPYPVPFSITLYLYLLTNWTTTTDVNTALSLPSPVSSVTNGATLKLEFNLGMYVQAAYDAGAGTLKDNLLGIISAGQTTTSASTDNFNIDNWGLSQNEWSIYAGSPTSGQPVHAMSTTSRVLSGASLRVVHRFETSGAAYITLQSWRVLDYDNTVRGFLV